MRNLELNRHMADAGAKFVRDARTAPIYRLWSIGDRYPGMIRAEKGGTAIALEMWEIDAAGLVLILREEPPGLTVGRVKSEGNNEVLGVLAEPYLLEGEIEITEFGGWRAYLQRETDQHESDDNGR